MLANVSTNFNQFFDLAKVELPFMAKLIFGLWVFNIINWALRSRFNDFGIYPRSLHGLFGIFASPFLHANFNHLFFNSFPLFVLGMFILALGEDTFIAVSVLIALMEGVLVWLFGRKYYHIGASGVISGYFGFLMGLAYFHPTIISILLAVVAIYYFGSIVAGIIPSSDLTSWECHLAGMISGIALLYAMLFVPGFESWSLTLTNKAITYLTSL
jgi:membrane associated rhomboid family serine protease